MGTRQPVRWLARQPRCASAPPSPLPGGTASLSETSRAGSPHPPAHGQGPGLARPACMTAAPRPGPQPRATARPSEDPTLPLAPRPSPAARTSATATASVAICHVLHSGSSAARSASSGGSSSSYTRRDCSPLSNTLRAPRHSLWRGCSLWRGAMRGAARGERGAWARRRGASESTGRGCPLLTARRVKKAATGGARGRRAGRTDGAA
jgi:hypothetical protein